MGASQRKEAVDYFSGLATAAEAPSDDALYERLRHFQKGICSGCELRNVALPIVKSLIECNGKTGRIQWLLHKAAVLLEQSLTNPTTLDAAVPALLFVVELVLRNVLLETRGNSASLLQLLEGTGGRNPTTMSQDSGGMLCAVLMDYVVKVPLTLDTAVVHHGVVRLLLTMTSSALHHNTEFSEERIDVFTEMIMSSSILGPCVTVLLQRLSEWGRGLAVDANSNALMLYAEGQEPGVLSLYGWFGSSATPPTKEEEIPIVTRKGVANTQLLHKNARTGEMVGRLSAELLAVLVAHQKGNGRNPALEHLKSLQSSKEMSFGALLKAIASKLSTCPALCMVLYAFLHDHPSFLRDVIGSAPGALVDAALSVAQVLFLVSTSVTSGAAPASKTSAPEASTAITVERDPLNELMMGNIIADLMQYAYPFTAFMTSSLLLIVSEDRVVDEMICGVARAPAFADKRLPKSVSVGSQLVFALCSGITRAIYEANASLADGLLSTLSNLSNFVHDMELQVAQRLLQLVLFLFKRVRWADEAYQPSAPPSPDSDIDPANVKIMADAWVQQLRGALEALENMVVRAGDRHNESLVYEVLYNLDHILPPTRLDAAESTSAADTTVAVAVDDNGGIDPAVKSAGKQDVGIFESQLQEAVSALHRVIQPCEEKVFGASNPGNVQEVLSIIRQTMSTEGAATGAHAAATEVEMHDAGGMAKGGAQDVELMFTYEESPHSYSFFGPFVWANLVPEGRRPGAVLWCTQTRELPLFPQ